MVSLIHKPQGIYRSNLITDIPPVRGDEDTTYPTQKPLALLRMLIKASSNEGDMVLDPFCGSGTTLVAAKQLDRTYIGMDKSEKACQIARERIEKIGGSAI